MQIHDNITIIGLGLMGSSLAIALKESGFANKVTGYARSAGTITRALDLNVIDSGSCELKIAVKDADIVVICTPISTYSNIAKELNSSTKKTAIITDVGSVKHNPTWQILSNLSEEKQPMLVPAHPIAGSDKSGIEAKNPDLYKDKKVILTPGPATSQNAVETIEKMWEVCGAQTKIMDSSQHDEAYASVSHATQLLAYASINCIDHYGNEAISNIAQNANEEFLAFNRIGNSNPVMWADIFQANKSYFLEQIGNINNIFSDIRDTLSYKPVLVAERIRLAKSKREEWCFEENLPNKINFNDDISDCMLLLVPKIIATGLVENTYFIDFAGSGFADVSRPLLSVDDTLESAIEENKDILIDFLTSLCIEIEGMHHIINFGETEDIAQELASAQEACESFYRIYESFIPSND